MGYDAKTERLVSIKKLAGKAQTSNDKGLSNEGLPSGLTVAAASVFGEPISTDPVSTGLYDITGKVEFLRLQATFIAGTTTASGRHGFELKLPADYEANSSNSSKGTYPFINDQVINITSGALQLVPPAFAIAYEAKPFYGGTAAKNSGTQIPVLDTRDWYLDYFNGIFFQQDPPGTGDHADNPDYIEAFLYVGDMLDTVVRNSGSAGGGSGGDADAQYLVLQATSSLGAERVFNPSTGFSVVDGGAGGNYTLGINNAIVATLTGSQFSGNVGITGSLGVTTGLSGSLTKLTDGTSYLIAGSNTTIVTSSSGAITISSATGTTYTAGDGLDLSGTVFSTDLKSNGGLKIDSTELAIDDSIIATLTGSVFSGIVSAPALSGSLTTLQDGSPFLISGTGISLATGSSGAITINSTAAGGSGDQNAEYIVATSTGSLPSAKTISAGAGITITTGSNSMIVSAVSILSKGRSKENYFVTASHPALSEFPTPLSNYSDVLQKPDLIDILVNGVLLHSGSSAQIAAASMDYRIASSGSLEFAFALDTDDIIDAIITTTTSGDSTDNTAGYLLQQATSSLPNSRTFTTGSGTTLQDSGPQGTFVFDTSPTTDLYILTSSHPLLNSLTIPNIDFAINARSFHKNQVFLNGVLMASGSTLDYTIDTPATGSLTFNLPLEEDDVVTIRQT